MSLSTILKTECPICKKIAIEKSSFKLGKTKIISLVCGHSITSESDVQSEDVYNSITFSDGKKPRQYQIDAIRFAEENNFNIIIADEQGLGKTIELACILKLHYKKLLPAVIAVPSTVKLQWLHELHRICCPNNSLEERQRFLVQVITSGKEKALPGFQIYIVTFDMLKKQDMFELVPDLKTIVIDECQRIKNHLSDRAKAVQKIASRCDYKIPMSGTPIKNNAGEYFTVLNLVAPTKFPQYQRYIDDYCDTYESGWYQKVGGLSNIERFKEDTKDIIIRRTKEEVKLNLPPFERRFHHVELDSKLNKAYGTALKELDDLFYDDEVSEFDKSGMTIAIYSRLRHITGLSKVEQCVDFATEFLLSCERKLVIYAHHKDVMDLIQDKLDKYLLPINLEKCVMLTGELSGDKRAENTLRFKENDKCRIMIASTLAAGEGLNLQFCSDAIMLERQWNPANEEQAEARFHRFGQENNVFVTYMLASGTIDEFFSELVEKKRAIVAGALDGKEIMWEEQSLMKELTVMLLTKGRQKWSL